MPLIADLKTLYHLTLAPVCGDTHAKRMESFYSRQADGYDDFRRRLLKGRQALYESIDIPRAGTWIDMGGGTGSNIEYIAGKLDHLHRVQIVDLSPSLLNVAQRRIRERGWQNVETVEADATTYLPAEQKVDVVTFSYSLTMIPDCIGALENALRLLKPGGTIGVVDFYVSHKLAPEGSVQHGWVTRTFWPTWFALDNVFLGPDMVAWLHRHFKVIGFDQCRASVPYLPLGRVPYFRLVGKKRD